MLPVRFLAALRSSAAFRIAVIAAITVAVVGFLLIHTYSPGGLLWNAAHGVIYLTDACLRNGPWSAPVEGCYKIPLKGVLVFSVLLVAIAAVLRYGRNSGGK
ncbi:MAG: hypothetical protein ABSD21_07815 [Rhizomicrobium sp.]|jgi:hypothetical protein